MLALESSMRSARWTASPPRVTHYRWSSTTPHSPPGRRGRFSTSAWTRKSDHPSSTCGESARTCCCAARRCSTWSGTPTSSDRRRWPPGRPGGPRIPCRQHRLLKTRPVATSAQGSLHECDDPCLFGGSQLLQRELDGPHASFVEVLRVAEAQRRVPRFELPCVFEVADDLAVPGIRGHPVPEFRRQGRRAGFDDRVEPLCHGAIRCRHCGDLRDHGAFRVRIVRGRLHLFDALIHRGFFRVGESLVPLFGRGDALRGLLCWFPLSHSSVLLCQI